MRARAQGERHAVVYATGANTFFGRAAALISGVHNVANIQKVTFWALGLPDSWPWSPVAAAMYIA
jgi:hypothetical protein